MFRKDKSSVSRRSFLKMAGASAASLSALGNFAAVSAQDAPLELTLWHSFGGSSAREMAINAMVEKFNADNPDIVLVPNGFPSQEYKQQILNTAFAGGDPPDIFTSVGFVWLQELADAGQVLEITDYYRENLADRYVPGMEFGYAFDGRVYGVPWRLGGTPFLFYNGDQLSELGFGPEALETVDGWIDVMDAALATGKTPVSWGNGNPYNAIHWGANFIKNEIGAESMINLSTSQGDVLWTDAEVVTAVQRLKDFYDAGYLGENTANEAVRITQERFLAGESVLWGTGGWLVRSVVTANEAGGNFDYVQFPVSEGSPGKGSDWIYWSSNWAASATDDERAREARIRVLDAFDSPEYHGLCFTFSREFYGAIGASDFAGIEIPPMLQKQMDLFDEASALVPIPDVAMPQAAAEVLRQEFAGVILGRVSVEDAMANIQRSVNRVYGR